VNGADGTWLIPPDKVRLAAIPVSTISCQTARLILLSMNVDLESSSPVNVTSRRQRRKIHSNDKQFFMVALSNRADHYIFALWFLLSIFFFPRLISAVADWMSTMLAHMMWP